MTEYTVDMIKVSDDIWGVGLVFEIEEILLPSGGDDEKHRQSYM